MAMTEVAREGILYERARKREQSAERRALKAKVTGRQQQKEMIPLKLPSIVRPEPLMKKDLKATLQGHTINARTVGHRQSDSEYESGEDSANEEDAQYLQKKASQSSNSAPALKVEEPGTFEDFRRAYLSKIDIEKWMHRPWFTTDTLQGMFSRLLLGKLRDGTNDYRLVRVEAVEDMSTASTYRIKPDGDYTRIRLQVSIGKSKKWIRMDGISSSPIEEKEVHRYEAELAHVNFPFPSKSDLVCIADRLSVLRQKPVTHEEIEYALKKKATMDTLYVNPAVHKTRLQSLKDQAILDNDLDRVSLVDAQLAELQSNALVEPVLKRPTAAPVPNYKQPSLKSSNTSASSDATNPFARRKTRSTFATAVLAGTNAVKADTEVEADTKSDMVIQQFSVSTKTALPSLPQNIDLDLDFELDIPDIVSSRLNNTTSSWSLHSSTPNIGAASNTLFNVLDLYTAKTKK